MFSNAIHLTSTSVTQTRTMGARIGSILSSPVVFLLFGDLGSGKTAFVQGLAKGLAVSENCYITSPTYTLINEYPAKIPILHVDLYRLNSPDDFEDIGLYDLISEKRHVFAVEWADRLDNETIENSIYIDFNILHDNHRAITITSNSPETHDLMQIMEKKLKARHVV